MLTDAVPVLFQNLLFKLFQHRHWCSNDVTPAALAKEFDVVFAHHPAIHHLNAFAPAIAVYHRLNDMLNSRHIRRISGENVG